MKRVLEFLFLSVALIASSCNRDGVIVADPLPEIILGESGGVYSVKVGNEVPDIVLPLLDGTKKNLKDYRGRYVVLNFWANGCSKSDAMLAELQSLYDILKGDSEFVIVSFALESNIDGWKESVAAKNINREGWVNACDGAGAESSVAKSFRVEKAPKIILIEPEGRAVTLDMDIDELIMRVEQIL